MPRLNQRIINDLSKILAPLMDTPDNRRALLIRSLPMEIVLRAPTEGTSPISAVVNIIQFLADYGAFEEDKQALWAVLEVAYDEVGLEKQDLIKSLESIINSSDDRISTDLNRTLTYEEFSLGDVFISYASADRDYMSKVYNALTHNGIKVWTDRDDLKPGTPDWDADLRRAISHAKAVILIATPHSRVSDYVRDEIRLAEMYGRPIIPIWSGGTRWMNSIPIGYGGIQYIDGRGENYSTAMVQLIAQLSSAESQEIAVEQIDFTPRNPYKGLNPFYENESEDFFGREQLIQDLIIKLDAGMRNNERLLAVVGPSGSGKSSVVMAGLLPKLRRGGYDDSENWVYLPRIVPGKYPIENLAIALAHELNFTVDSVEDNLAKSRGLHQLISLMRPQSRVVLFIDQFEELFTQTENEQDRRRYLDLITTAVTESDGALTVVLTLRADFYDRPMHYRDFAILLQNNNEYVLPLSAEELRAVISKPATQDDVQLIFDENLVGDLLYEVKDEVGALPLLQFSLDQLFKNRNGQHITRDAYHKIGGVRGALAQWAQETYDGLASDEDRELAKALFLRLVDPGATEQDTTRRRVFLRELALEDDTLRQRMEVVSNAFIDARLLVSSTVMASNSDELEATIEVTHEAVIREWPLLKEWLIEARDDIQLQNTINSDALDWVQRDENEDSPRLYRETQLQEAQEWLSRNFVTDQERRFIEAGVKLEANLKEKDQIRVKREEENARRAQRFTYAAAALGVMVLIAVIVGGVLSQVATSALRDVDDANRTLTPVEQTLVAGLEDVNDAQTEIAGVQPTVDSADTQVAGVQPTVNQANTQIAEIQPTVIFAQTEVAGINPTVDAANTQVAAINPTLEAAEAQVQAIQPTVAFANTQVAGVDPTLNAANTQVAGVDPTLNVANTQVAAVQPLVDLANTQIAAIEPTLNSASTQVAAVNPTVYAAETRVALVDPTLDAASTQVAGVDPTLNAANTQVAGVDPTLNAANTQVAGVDPTLNAANTQVAAVNPTVYAAETRVALVDPTLNAANTQVAAVNPTVDGANTQVAAVQPLVDNANTQIAAIEPTLNSAATQVAAVNPTVYAAETRVAVVDPTLNAANTQVAGVDPTLNAANTQVAGVDPTLNAANTQVAGVNPTLDAANTQVAGVDPTLNAANTQVAGVAPTLDQANTQIAQSEPTLTAVAEEVIAQSSIASSLRLAVNAEQILDVGNPDLAIALILEAYKLNQGLAQTQRVLNESIPETVRLNFSEYDAFVFSPDGLHLLISTSEGLNLWNLTERRIVQTYSDTFGNDSDITRLVYSHSGQQFVAGYSDGNTVLWNVDTAFSQVEYASTGRVNAIAFDPADDLINIATNRVARVWEVETGVLRATLNSNNGTIFAVDFTADSRYARAYDNARDNPTISIYNLQSNTNPIQSPGSYGGYSPDLFYAYRGGDGRDFFSLWRPVNIVQDRIFRLTTADSDVVETVAFSEDRSQIMVHIESRNFTDTQRTLYNITNRYMALWNIADGSEALRFTVIEPNPNNWDINAMTLSVDKRFALTGGRYGSINTVALWDVETGSEIRRFTGHTSDIQAVGFSPNGLYAYSQSSDNLRIWDIGEANTDAIGRLSPLINSTNGFSFSANGEDVYIAFNDTSMARWNILTDTQYGDSRFLTNFQNVVDFNSQRSLAIVDSAEGLVLWDLITGEFRYQLDEINSRSNNIVDLSFSNDGSHILISSTREVVNWNVDGQTIDNTWDVRSAVETSIDNNNEIVAIASLQSIQLFDAITNQELVSLTVPNGIISAMAMSSNADFIIAAANGRDNILYLWDARTGEQIYQLIGHTSNITTVAYSPDNKTAVSGSIGGNIIVWDLDSGTAVGQLTGHTGAIGHLEYSADGRTLVSSSTNMDDGLLFWRIETVEDTVEWVYQNRVVRDLTCAERDQFGVQPYCINGLAPIPTITPTISAPPTFTPTVTPRPTFTPSPTALPQGVIIVAQGSDAFVRSGAGAGFSVVARIPRGTRVSVIEVRQDIGWVLVRLDTGTEGWVGIALIDLP